jgi:DNA-binding NarL/FixJ family response regulator
MAKDILVSLLSDDLFSLNWMSLLIVRDWRTRVFTEGALNNPLEDNEFRSIQHVDVVVADLDSFMQNTNLFSNLNRYLDENPSLLVVGVGSRVEPMFFQRIANGNIGGYLLKSEISSSLGWAVSFAYEGSLVFTPGAHQAAFNVGFRSTKPVRVINSRIYPGMTDRQSEIARLAIIFSVGRHDLADELKISDQWSYGVVSELYEKLGLNALAQDKNDILASLDNDPIIKVHMDEILAELGTSKKARDLETLAFHILTLPEIN